MHHACCQCIIRKGAVTGTSARFGRQEKGGVTISFAPTDSDPRSSRRSFRSACHVAARRAQSIDASGMLPNRGGRALTNVQSTSIRDVQSLPMKVRSGEGFRTPGFGADAS